VNSCHVSCVLPSRSMLARSILFARGCSVLRHPPARETPIERIYREVHGKKMPDAVKRILLKPYKSKIKLKPWN
jgi:hypothetical protein